MNTGGTRALSLVLLLSVACLVLASCSEDNPSQPPTDSTDSGPFFDAPSSVLGETGVDAHFGFRVWDPDGDAIDSVWADGADSLLFEPTTGVGQLFWRACQPGSFIVNMRATSGSPLECSPFLGPRIMARSSSPRRVLHAQEPVHGGADRCDRSGEPA